MQTIVFGYLRVSGTAQVDGDGPDRQRAAIQSFCDRHGLRIEGEFFDRGISGTIEGLDRPEFSDMIERIECMRDNGVVITGIVVERIDRMARDLMVSELMLAECRQRKIKVFSADQEALIDIAADDTDPTRVLIRQIMGALAQWEKSTIVRKLRVARERNIAIHGKCEGRKAFGWRPAEREVRNYIFSLVDQEPRPTWEKITTMINFAGFRNRKGNRWTRQQIYDLVRRARSNEFRARCAKAKASDMII